MPIQMTVLTNAEGPAAICVDKPTQYTNAIAGYEEAGLAEPTRNEKQQDLYYLAQAADVEVSEITLDQTAVTLKIRRNSSASCNCQSGKCNKQNSDFLCR